MSVTATIGLLELASSAGKLNKVVNNLNQDKNILNSKSWIQMARITDVEPLVLIDDSLRKQKILDSVLQAVLKTNMSYYLRAADLMQDLSSLEIVKRLNSLNPHRSTSGTAKNMIGSVTKALKTASMENSTYDDIEPVIEPYEELEFCIPVKNKITEALEASIFDTSKKIDLSIGQSVKVGFKTQSGGEKIEVNVNFKLLPYFENSDVIITSFGIGSNKNTLSERRHRLKAGELTRGDFWLLKDIIKEHRNTLIKSKTSFYLDSLNRVASQKLTKNMNMNSASSEISNTTIVSKATAKMIERKVRVDLDNYSQRQNLMDKTSNMLLFVVDVDNEDLVIYRYGIKESITLDFTALASYGEKNSDLMDLVKSTMFTRR